MIKRLIPALALAATPALSFDMEAMTAAERNALRSEIRAYLLENPEVLMEAIAVLEERQASSQATTDAALVRANIDSLKRDGHSWVGGNPEGDVTIVEFLDYRCGFCRRAFPEVEKLVEGDGNIRIIIKELPILGPQSDLASRFAIATKLTAGDDAYKAVHDALMVFRGQFSAESLGRLATDQGLDAAEILARMESPEVSNIIVQNRTLAQAMQISGTPTFVIGNQMLRGFLPLEGMQALVEEERG